MGVEQLLRSRVGVKTKTNAVSYFRIITDILSTDKYDSEVIEATCALDFSPTTYLDNYRTPVITKYNFFSQIVNPTSAYVERKVATSHLTAHQSAAPAGSRSSVCHFSYQILCFKTNNRFKMSATDYFKLNSHKLFKKVRETLPQNIIRTQNVLTVHDDVLYTWDFQDSCVLTYNLKYPTQVDGQPNNHQVGP